jgi:starch-binding outer membrane protein, SusD/RagB family
MKMKKLFLIFTAAVGFISCETEYLPNDILAADTVYTTVADLQDGMDGVMANYNPYPIINFNSIFTDECKIGCQSGGQEVTKYNMQLTAAVNGNDIWVSSYRTINFANKIIAAAAGVPAITAADIATKNNILAQCYALRAHCHLNLLAHHATTMADPSALGVIYLDFVPAATAELPRNTVGECFAKMNEDLDTANSLFNGASNKIFMNREAVTFMRAKIALFTGDNAAAITFADQLISLFPLATTAEYINMFKDTGIGFEKEVIFKAERKGNNAFIGGIWYFTGTGGDFMGLSNSMVNSLSNTDIRRDVVRDPVLSTTACPQIGKYLGSEGFPYMNDVKVMRVAEMYLVKAEAQAKLSQFTAASATMQTLVNARYGTNLPPVKAYTNLSNAILDILEERKVELAFEGHRYVDIKRLRAVSNTGILRNPLDCGGAAPCELSPSDDRFTMPIPLAEMNANRNMVQNPGY